MSSIQALHGDNTRGLRCAQNNTSYNHTRIIQICDNKDNHITESNVMSVAYVSCGSWHISAGNYKFATNIKQLKIQKRTKMEYLDKLKTFSQNSQVLCSGEYNDTRFGTGLICCRNLILKNSVFESVWKK